MAIETSPLSDAAAPSDGPISPTSVCGANRLVTMMPTEAANSSVWDRVMMLPSACGGRSAKSAVATRALSVQFIR
ncbi:hypothetical protein RFM41_24990 [Mesorhizobium sp. VK25A]|uniref:Uncharacterized protein n=1 Tax=Mesorhizobium vachelliae TaxID=3072309 RepID=A0ABU5ACJ5_9HYPH|nr:MULTISPECIES: hypothetical protein [unclassified Mesorhizobium]MDX8534384.1 hypothetical protein [Mesorhizobium sp. VK25D]MDX8547026.1 hypothetical protein [Mesorhizobium sp. VK25A]